MKSHSVDSRPRPGDRPPSDGSSHRPLSGDPVDSERRVAVSAAGVWVGGGRVLLEGLLTQAGSRVSQGIFDARAREWVAPCLPAERVRFVLPRALDRLTSLNRLACSLGPQHVLLCFNSLPPPVRSAARTVVFVHAPHIGGVVDDISYAPRVALRLAFEKMWFRAAQRNADEFWVQTETMASTLARRWSLSAPVRVVPLADPMLLRDASDEPPRASANEVRGFVYPADGLAHKNHERLLQAWAVLAQRRDPPPLVLTLRPDELRDASRRAEVDPRALNVTSVGPVPRERVIALLREYGALIFPSLAETFGLPLLEAERAGVKIVASERDFVRDVCRPHETFDPKSPVSIARGVARLTGGDWGPAPLVSPSAFMERLEGLSRRI